MTYAHHMGSVSFRGSNPVRKMTIANPRQIGLKLMWCNCSIGLSGGMGKVFNDYL